MDAFKLKIKAGPIVFASLAWSYLAQPVLWPFESLPFLKVILLAAAATGAAYLYRDIGFEILLSAEDFVVLTLYAGLFALLNSRMLFGSLGGDELYHAERAVFYLHAVKFLPAAFPWRMAIQKMPITELNAYISLGIFASVGLAWLVWTQLYGRLAKRSTRYIGYFIAASAAGLAAAALKVPVEPHPPLRLLPLFMSQLFFGLQDFSFRVPGVIAMAVASFLAWRLVRGAQKGRGRFFSFVVGISLYMIPSVFHVSAIAEPSVWGFIAAAFLLYALYAARSTQNDLYMIWGSLAIGIGCLARQNAVLLWPIFFLFCFLYRRFVRRRLLIFIPALFILPYAMTVLKSGHPVVHFGAESASPVQNILNSLATGIGPEAILKSAMLPWILFALTGLAALLFVYRDPLVLFALVAASGYGLFFAIGRNLWGMGRYQAEYIAPVMALVIVAWAIHLKPRRQFLFGAILVALSAYSFFWNLTFPQDIRYEAWARQRLSTESIFPYKEAVGFLQRQDSGGRFIVIGGSGTYGRMLLWLRGFNAEETETYWSAQKEFNAMSENSLSLADFLKFLSARQVNYFLVQYGDRRELELRSPALAALIGTLETARLSPYALQQTFIGSTEGAIDLYGKVGSRYLGGGASVGKTES